MRHPLARAVAGMDGLARAENIQLIPDTAISATVEVDDRIIQVLTNLISNAIKFSSDGACGLSVCIRNPILSCVLALLIKGRVFRFIFNRVCFSVSSRLIRLILGPKKAPVWA